MDTAPTDIYTLSLHDALPISRPSSSAGRPDRGPPPGPLEDEPGAAEARWHGRARPTTAPAGAVDPPGPSTARSEEHTSELQSRRDLVCRLLLEKKKNKNKVGP